MGRFNESWTFKVAPGSLAYDSHLASWNRSRIKDGTCSSGINKSEWLQVLKSIKVDVNGRFIFFFFFFFLKNRKISSFISDQMFFFFFFLFVLRYCVRQFLMDSLFIEKDNGPWTISMIIRDDIRSKVLPWFHLHERNIVLITIRRFRKLQDIESVHKRIY